MIYLLEDDESIRKFVIYALKSTGFDAEGFETPSEFYAALEKNVPELILLDVMLPEEDGLSVLAKLRTRKDTEKLPILMLTAKGTEYDKVIGLDSGADDYITKPFGTMELLARVKAHLRRSARLLSGEEYVCGSLYVCPERHLVKAGGREVALTFKEFELLCLLIQHPGIVYSREQLLQTIWGYAYDRENRTVDVHIKTLRSKLGECGSCIETVRGIGYRMNGQGAQTPQEKECSDAAKR